MKIILFLLFLVAIFQPLMGFASDEQYVHAVHNAWKNAFEQADIATVDEIWTHTPDTNLITIAGVRRNGWQKVRSEIKTTFDLIGKTTLTVSNLVITVSQNEASATMDYRWSLIPDFPLKATELYRKVGDTWKMYAQDGTGGLQPLRPDDETQIQLQVQQIQATLLDKNLKALEAEISDDFTFVGIGSVVHGGFDKAAIGADLERIVNLHLQVIYLIDDTATAHYTLTALDIEDRDVLFIYNNEVDLTHINFSPKGFLAVPPSNKIPTLWVRIKAEVSD